MKRLPIAKTELRDIVEGDFCYVDKTGYIRMLLDENEKNISHFEWEKINTVDH